MFFMVEGVSDLKLVSSRRIPLLLYFRGGQDSVIEEADAVHKCVSEDYHFFTAILLYFNLRSAKFVSTIGT